MEQLANDFNINSRPVLILMVEGQSEARVFPEMIEKLFGSSIRSLGIQIIPLRGIGNFDGSKTYDPQGALIRFVDDYHSRGTIVFVVVDNEGRAENTKKRLIRAKSLHQNRMVTREEYIEVWEKNVELDNFTDEEIAETLSQSVSNQYTFSSDEIHGIRTTFGKPGTRRLENLFVETTGCSLDKPRLLSALAARLSTEQIESAEAKRRPILSVWNVSIEMRQIVS